jgi:hypothetical protein
VPKVPEQPEKLTFEYVMQEIKKTYIIKDEGIVKLIFAVVISNRKNRKDKPVWLLYLGGSSSGKSILTQLLSKVGPWIIDVDTFSVNTLASGFAGDGKDHSLLHKANHGVLVFKDLTTLLSMNRDSLSAIMGQLRAIYDGKFDRPLGNGKDVKWLGKVGIIATGTIDVQRRMREYSKYGERFLNYIPEVANGKDMARKAIRNQGSIAEQEEYLAELVSRFINQKLEEDYDLSREISYEIENRMVDIADLCTLARSPVNMNERNPAVVDYVPEREQPPRMAMTLKNTAIALMHISSEKEMSKENEDIIYKVALDSIPVERKMVLELLTEYRGGVTSNIATRLNLSTETVRAWLNQLDALKLIDRFSGSGRAGDLYSLRKEYKDVLSEYLGIETQDRDIPGDGQPNDPENAYISDDIEVPYIETSEDVNEQDELFRNF